VTDSDRRERLDVVAALLTYDAARSDAGGARVHADGTPLSDAEQDLIRVASHDEWALAEGLAGPEPVSDPDEDAIADLLRQAFLVPDGSRHALAPGERTAAFAGLFRTLALPGLDADAREMAGPLLDALGPCE